MVYGMHQTSPNNAKKETWFESRCSISGNGYSQGNWMISIATTHGMLQKTQSFIFCVAQDAKIQQVWLNAIKSPYFLLNAWFLTMFLHISDAFWSKSIKIPSPFHFSSPFHMTRDGPPNFLGDASIHLKDTGADSLLSLRGDVSEDGNSVQKMVEVQQYLQFWYTGTIWTSVTNICFSDIYIYHYKYL